MKTLVVAFVLLFASSVVAQQADFSKVQIKATKVAGNVYMLEGAGGNIGVSVGADGILIVDDEFAPLADKIRASLKTLGHGKLRFHSQHALARRSYGRQCRFWTGGAGHRARQRAPATLDRTEIRVL